MPKDEDSGSMEPGRLAWRRMQARKFVWQDGDVTIMPSGRRKKEDEGRTSGGRPEESRDRD